MKLDQEKSKKGDQKVVKKEPKLIVEMLKFEQEEKKGEVKVEEQPFVLKEVGFEKFHLNDLQKIYSKVVLGNPERDMVTPPPPIDDVTNENKENSSPAFVGLHVGGGQKKGEKPKKKCAMFADTVEVLQF